MSLDLNVLTLKTLPLCLVPPTLIAFRAFSGAGGLSKVRSSIKIQVQDEVGLRACAHRALRDGPRRTRHGMKFDYVSDPTRPRTRPAVTTVGVTDRYSSPVTISVYICSLRGNVVPTAVRFMQSRHKQLGA